MSCPRPRRTLMRLESLAVETLPPQELHAEGSLQSCLPDSQVLPQKPYWQLCTPDHSPLLIFVGHVSMMRRLPIEGPAMGSLGYSSQSRPCLRRCWFDNRYRSR